MSINVVDRRVIQDVFGREVSGLITGCKLAHCVLRSNNLMLGCAMEFTENQNQSKVWTHVTLKVTLVNSKIQLLSSRHIEQACFGAASVIDLKMEPLENGDYSQVACVWHHATMDNTFLDMNFNFQIIDRQEQESLL